MASNFFAPQMMDLKPFLDRKYAIAGQEADARTLGAKAGMLTAQTAQELNPSRIGLNTANAADATAMAGTRDRDSRASAFGLRAQGANALASARGTDQQTDFLNANPTAQEAAVASKRFDSRGIEFGAQPEDTSALSRFLKGPGGFLGGLLGR